MVKFTNAQNLPSEPLSHLRLFYHLLASYGRMNNGNIGKAVYRTIRGGGVSNLGKWF